MRFEKVLSCEHVATHHSSDVQLAATLAEQLSLPLLEFMRRCIPTLDAAKVLLYVAENRGRSVAVEEIVVEIPAAILSSATVRAYASVFARCGLMIEDGHRFRYAPTPSVDKLVGELAEWYNQRPVSLVVAISKIAAGKRYL